MRDATDEVQGLARIAVASHVVCPVFDDALTGFHAAHPHAGIAIDVQPSHKAVEAVLARSASFAICLVHNRNPRLEYRRLYREFFGLFCGPRHPYFGRDGLTLADLAGQSSVSFETDRLEGALRSVTLMRAEARLGDRIVGTSSHLEEVRRMIVAGLGIGPLPLHVARGDVEAGLLWQLPPFDRPAEIDVHVVWNPRARLNRAEAAFLSELLARIDATPIEARTYR